MAIKANIKMVGPEAAKQRIEFRKGNLKKFDEPLRKVKKHMMTMIKMNFRTQGGTFGEKWAPLKKSTIKEKERLAKLGAIKKTNVKKPLIRTGRMKNSFRGRVYRGLKDGVSRLRIDNPTPYFIKHQSKRSSSRMVKNLNNKETRLPRRVMLKITDRSRKKIRQIFDEWLIARKQKNV